MKGGLRHQDLKCVNRLQSVDFIWVLAQQNKAKCTTIKDINSVNTEWIHNYSEPLRVYCANSACPKGCG